ncbi:hypothetical protein IW261DRAFT_1664543 [Armillaria novae-zelandiae]|uniref:Uncharacterized protein n=1 Tax=Armillaria novae-zelandiae TaxID=153914 RepID=A0AA39PMH9_9AGAR|nr:hypothetical protein IW261DRAFT_1664543 [Armillaria novae-zelandiae]
MATQANIPPELTDHEKAFMAQYLDALDANLNYQILYALLHGIYTGILAVILWNIFINKCWPKQRALVVIIILLHVLITVNFATNWAFTCAAFVENGQSFWTVYSKLGGINQVAYLETGIAASMSTMLSDSYIIWCCWEVWGRRWLVVLLPILSLTSATVSKIIEIHHEYLGISSSIFVTCTVLIIFRILTVTGVRQGEDGRLRVYRRFIEVLVESSALYSIALIFFLAFFLCNNFGWYYADAVTSVAKGIAPTLLVGRAAAGHTRPTEDHDEITTVSTLRFQTSLQSSRTSQIVTSSLQESNAQRAGGLERDIEAQTEQPDDLIVSTANMQ